MGQKRTIDERMMVVQDDNNKYRKERQEEDEIMQNWKRSKFLKKL